MAGSLFMTGATGMLGREIVRDLLATTDIRLALLVRGRHSVPALLRDAFHLDDAPLFAPRVRLLVGNVTEPGLGLSDRARARLAREVNWVLHAAAETRFDRPLSAVRRVNVAGTRNVVDFSRRVPQIEQVGLISSAFVSGKRIGTILERERVHRAGFINTYERSKYEAEAVLERTRDVPWSIYRLSTLIGNADTGSTSHFTSPHHALRIMHLGLASIVPGDPNYSVDLMPTDFAARTVNQLFVDRFTSGQVFHLVAGPEKSYSLREIIDRSFEDLQRLDPTWGSRPHPRPVIGSQAAFDLFVQAAERSRNVLMQQVTGMLRYFAGQFSYPKHFDTTTTRATLPSYEQSVPDIRSYYDKIVGYCLRTAWGRHG